MKKTILFALFAVFYLGLLSAQNRSNVSVIPAQIDETLNPNEVYDTGLTLTNNGSDAVDWNAELTDAGTWLSLDITEGTLQPAENIQLNVNLNAEFLSSGDTLTGEIHFIFTPDSDTLVVPVTMAVFGDTLGKVINFMVNFYDEAFGVVKLKWRLKEFSPVVLQHYLIKRNGAPIATTQYTVYYDSLSQFGSYSYEVMPVYNEGNGIKRGPVDITWIEPELSFEPDTVASNTWAGYFSLTSAVISNPGDGELYFEFTGFDNPDYTKDFVTSVIPFNGRLQGNTSVTVYITTNASDYSNGDYLTDLPFTTNKTNPDDTLYAQMNVSTPSVVFGTVNDCFNASNLLNVKIQANNLNDSSIFTTYSDINGQYRLLADEGDYMLVFSRAGYQSDTIDTVTLTAGDSLSADNQLCVELYPSGEVLAEVDENAGVCHVNWNMPTGSGQIVYDDSEAEDFFLFNAEGSAIAVRFTPDTYPATITGGMLYVGKGTETSNKTGFYGSEIIVGILNVDSVGMPGVIIDTATISINGFGWIDFSGRFNTIIETGDFFLAVWQVNSGVNAVPVGIDEDNAANNRSYYRLANTSWGLSLVQGMMIRAFTRGPINYAVSGFNNYQVWRISQFDPNVGEYPQEGYGTRLLLGNTIDTSFTDAGYGTFTEGWYDYCVKTGYNDTVSDCSYSNIIQSGKDVVATVNVTHCGGKPADSAFVTLTGHDYPYDVIQVLSDTNGVALFDSVIKGIYNIKVFKIGYQAVVLHDIIIDDDYTTNVAIQENAFPARNLFVDSITSVATWDEPLVTALPLETFEDTLFPPEGWQASTGPCPFVHWHRAGPDELFGTWVMPPWEGYYALINDDLGSTGCVDMPVDYLITPELDLREDENFLMTFDRFFDALYGGVSTIEYSVDSGVTWAVIQNLIPSMMWEKEYVDLSALSGANGLGNVMLAFVFTDGNAWTGGWAVDNVQITSDPAVIKNYLVYLDGYQIDVLPPDQRTYLFEDLEFGNYYTAAVRAGYSCGMSEKVEYSWQSGYLYPPRNLVVDYTENTDDVLLKWNPPFDNTIQAIPDGLLSFTICRNGDSLSNIPYQGQQPDEVIEYLDMDNLPGKYNYKITALYNLDSYGYPGQNGESGPLSSDSVWVKWGFDLPFEEKWEIPDFNYNKWVTDTVYWKINNEIGNDVPSAMFAGDSTLGSNYMVALSSVPFRGDKLFNKLVYLDFDLRLDDLSLSGNEKLKVEIYNGNVWTALTTITNTGSIGFDEGTYHLDITGQAIGNIFRIRFAAVGNNPLDAVWYVDNIRVYYKCKPPESLTGKYVWYSNGGEDKFAAKICWEAPDVPVCQLWLFWDNGENFTTIGLNDGGDFSVAARWEPDQLAGLDNNCITKVNFFMGDDDFDDIIVRIWKGTNAADLIYEQYVTGMINANQWNTVVLNTPVPIDISEELWVGYTIVGQQYGKFPVGCDAGPAVVGYGNKITTDGINWDNLSDFGLNYNWNIAARIELLPEGVAPLKPIPDDFVYHTADKSLVQGAVGKQSGNYHKSSKDSELSGFKIYRSKTGQEGSYKFYSDLPFEGGVLSYCFEDKYPNVEPQQSYWYKVSAVWVDNADSCESDFARSDINPDEDFVTVFITDVEEFKKEEIAVYPNPADNLLNIIASETITRITVYSYSGKTVFNQTVNKQNKFVLNTATFHAGVYIAKIKTGTHEVFKRFVVVR
jgi:hypothetical protein